MNTFFWPEITDLKSASSAARQGFWAALWICCADIILGGLAIFGEKPVAGIDPSIVLDGLIFGAIAIGVWVRLRVAAVAGLLLFIIESIIQAYSLTGPWNPVVGFLQLLMFVTSARGTFRYHAYLKQPIREAVSRKPRGSFVLVIFSVLRRIRSIRRKVFGKDIPHWAEDLFDNVRLLSSLNVLQLVPTVWVILFFPAHFFYRVPQILSKRPSGYKPPYRKPIGFGVRLITLTLAGDLVLYQRLGFGHMQLIVFAAFCVSLPLIIAVVSVLFWCICAPYRLMLQYSGFYINSAHFLVVLDPSVYRRIRLSERCWGFIYYYGYALCIPQFAFLFGAALVFLSFARTDVPDASQSGNAEYLLIALVLLLDWVFIIPYCELLRVLVDYPTKRMLQSDIQKLTGALRHCEYLLDHYAKAKDSWSGRRDRKQASLYKQLSRVLEGGVHDAWMVLEQRLRQDRRIEPQLNEGQLARFYTARSNVYSSKSFTSFTHAWEAFEPGRNERFAYVNKMLQAIRIIAAQKP